MQLGVEANVVESDDVRDMAMMSKEALVMNHIISGFMLNLDNMLNYNSFRMSLPLVGRIRMFERCEREDTKKPEEDVTEDIKVTDDEVKRGLKNKETGREVEVPDLTRLENEGGCGSKVTPQSVRELAQVGEEECILVGRKRMFSEIDNCVESEETPGLLGEQKLVVKCCSFQCNLVGNVDEVERTLKVEFGGMSKAASKAKLLEHIKAQSNLGFLTDRLNWMGTYLCSKLFSQLSGLSRYLVDNVIQSYNRGVCEFTHGNSGMAKFSETRSKFKIWVKGFLSKNSQSAPDNNVQVLAHWVTVGDMHEWYMRETVRPHLAKATFYKYMKTHFGPYRLDRSEPQVRFSLYSSHSICDQCTAFNTARRSCKIEAEVNLINQAKMAHMTKAAASREKMNELIQQSIQFPADSMVIMEDGMDNSKSYLPNYREKTKKLAGMFRLPTKIQGGIIYSGHYLMKRKVVFFLNHDHYEQSSNMIVSSTFLLLEGFVEDKWQLPRTLHVFADNCGRENKNRLGTTPSSKYNSSVQNIRIS